MTLRHAIGLLCIALVAGCDEGSTVPAENGGLIDGGTDQPDARLRDDPDVGEQADADPLGPRINTIIPRRGDVAGGTRIRVVGRDFIEGMVVRIGDRLCEAAEVESENHVRCTTPPGDQVGTVDVTVLYPGGDLPAVVPDGFTYFRPLEIEAVDPNVASARGGAEVTVDGRGFEAPITVLFGGDRAPTVEVLNLNRMIVTVPRGEPGVVDLVVRNGNGEARLERGFTRIESLVVSGVVPRWGSEAGGDEVTVSGAGLTADSVVQLDGVGAEVLGSELGRTRLRIRTPAHAPGVVDLGVSNLNGTAGRAGAFLYVADADGPFGILGVVPSRVPSTGGATFVVGGNGFDEETRVELAGVLVPCARENGRVLTCTAPPHAAGSVEVAVVRGEQRAAIADGLTYFDEIEVFDVRPERGAIAGGTLVELIGRGLVRNAEYTLEGQALEIVEVFDGDRLLARTPPGAAGFASLRASTADDETFLQDAYEYFNPSTRFGGVWGDPIGRSVNVTVLDAVTGDPVVGAAVLVVSVDGLSRWGGDADAKGQVTISELDLTSPVSVTAAQVGYEVQTIERVTNENVTIYIIPHEVPPGMGNREPIPPARLVGHVVGLDKLEKPLEPGLVLAAFVETTHSSYYNRPSAPWPDPNGILLEDGPFEVIVRPGQMAVVVTAGYVFAERLTEFRQGQVAYWTMRQEVTPIAMGFQRFLSVSPGNTSDEIEVVLDRPMDLEVPVTLGNPSGGVPGAPAWYEAQPIIDFGPDGYFQLDSKGAGEATRLRVPFMPDMREWDDDLDLAWIGTARASEAEWAPYTRTFETDRHLLDGVHIGPFVGTPNILAPQELMSLGPNRLIRWEMHPGVDGPTEPADVNLVQISSTMGLPLWTHITPGAVTEYELPVLPDDLLPGGLLDGQQMYLTIIPMIIDGHFDYEDFSYGDIGANDRSSFSVMSIPFLQ